MRCQAYLRIIVISLVFVSSGTGFRSIAQDYTFLVMASKGESTLQRVGTTNKIPLKTGERIFKGDRLVASNGAYIGLMHRSGQTIELNQSGVHSVSELETKLGSGPTGVARRYMDFLVSKINGHERQEERNYRNSLKATGAVERAVVASNSIVVRIKETKNANKVYGETTSIKWEPVPGAETYVVNLYNIFNQPLMVIETSDTELLLDFTTEKLAAERFILFNIKSKGKTEISSRDFGLQRISKNQAVEFTDQLNRLKNELSGETSLNKIVIASFFEENKLYLDALTYYEEAVRLSPEIEDYRLMYQDFISLNGLGN